MLRAGDLPLRNGGSGRLTVLAAQFRTVPAGFEGGAVYLVGALGRESTDGRIATTVCGSEIRPAGTPADEMVVLLRCADTGADQDPPTGTFVVVAPPEATTAHLWHGDQLIGDVRLADGVATVPAPEQTFEVEAVDADGAPLERRAPMGTVDFGD